MIGITICHSPADAGAAESVRARLERCAEARVDLERLKSGESVADVWDRGLSSHGLLLILSPDAVPARGGREAWSELLEHIESNDQPSVATLQVRSCVSPALLRRKNSFDFANAEHALRSLQRWAITLHDASEEPSFTPASLSSNRDEAELCRLEEVLVAGSGTAVIGGGTAIARSALAQAFARRARPYFRDTIWTYCGERSSVSIACEIAAGLGLSLDSVDDHRLSQTVQEHRVLVVLDDLRTVMPLRATPEGSGAVLLTTSADAPTGMEVVHVQSTGSQPTAALAESEQGLWNAMSACWHLRVPLALAGRVAGISDATEVCAALEGKGITEPLDRHTGLYRLIHVSRCSPSIRRRHATELLAVFRQWRKHLTLCRQWIPEVAPAYDWAESEDWELATQLAHGVLSFLQGSNRGAESAELLDRLAADAVKHHDAKLQAFCENELSWLGRFPTAPRSPAAAQQLRLEFAS